MLTRALDGVTNRTVTWTAFSKPKQINAGGTGCGSDCSTFTYGPDRQLVKQVVKAGGATRSIYYIGPHFEVEVGSVTEYRSHALANGEVIFTQVEDTGGIGWQAYYNLQDHLGSVDKRFQTIGGSATVAYSYDAYGRRRNSDWTNDGSGSQMVATLFNHQGYTGHEMLDNVALIHMQGRVSSRVVLTISTPIDRSAENSRKSTNFWQPSKRTDGSAFLALLRASQRRCGCPACPSPWRGAPWFRRRCR